MNSTLVQRRCLIALMCMCIGAEEVLGQARLLFNNRIPPNIDAPVFHTDCTTPLEGPQFLVAPYAGPEGALESELVQVSPPVSFRTGSFAGYWISLALDIPFANPGQRAVVQARVWEAGAGTFEAAQAGAGAYGMSQPLTIHFLGTPLSLLDTMEGLQSFCLVPEPSPFWFWGASMLLFAGWWRRKRRRECKR
jgi:hypothetical protein